MNGGMWRRGLALAVPWDQRLARWLVRPLARTPVHPNAITTLGLLSGLGSGFLFATGDASVMNLGALLFMFAAFVDHADGELARLTGKTSVFGHYYDHVSVAVSYTAMFVGVGFGLTGSVLGGWSIPMGMLAGAAVATTMTMRLGVEMRRGKTWTRQGNISGFEPEDALYLVGPVTWVGLLLPFLVLASIGAPLFLLWTAWRFTRGGPRAGPAGSREDGEAG